MESNLYEELILQAHTKIDKISEFLCKNANNLQAHEMEKQLFSLVLEIGKTLMSGYFVQVTNNDVGQSIINKDIEFKRHNKVGKDYFSVFGKMKVERTGYWKKGEDVIYPLDIQCNMPERCYSYFLQEIMDNMSVNSPFLECENSISTLFNLTIHDKQFEDITRDTSANYQEYYQQNSAPLPESEGEFQVLSFDGKGVPMIKKEAAKIKGRLGKGEKKQKKKEALVGISYTVDKIERTAQEVAQNLIFPKTTEEKNKNEKNKKVPKAQNIRRIASLKQEKSLTIEQVQKDAQKRNKDNTSTSSVTISVPTLY